MPPDALTISAFLVSLVFLIVLLILMRRSVRTNERLIREVAGQAALLTEENDARALCRRIRNMYPSACPGLDFTIRCENGKARIECWNMNGAQPSGEKTS